MSEEEQTLGLLETAGKTEEEIVAMLPEVYRLIREVLDTYMDLDEDTKRIVAAWTLAAPYYFKFYAFPYLFINASHGSGKTRLLNLLNAMLPNSIPVANMSESAMFRVRESGEADIFLMDEVEHLHGKEKSNLMDLLNMGYKKGGTVLRVEGDKVKKVKRFRVYGPIALANIRGMDAVLESKCITIVLQKTRDKRIIQMPESMFQKDVRIKAIRNYFDPDCVYVGSCVESSLLAPMYAIFSNIYNITFTYIPTSTSTTYDIKKFMDGCASLQVDGRNFELWLPLVSLTYITNTSIFTELLEVAKRQREKQEEAEAEEDRDTMVALQLHSFMQEHGKGYRLVLKQFIETFDAKIREWASPEWASRLLRRLGVISSVRRRAKGNEYEIDMAKLRKYLETRNAMEDYEPSPRAQEAPQRIIAHKIKDNPPEPEPLQDAKERKEQPSKPEKLELQGGGVCPRCGTKGDLWKYKNNFMCTDCVAAEQNAGE